ncbi:MAG: decarboxylating 6-phosphogluconate dehydrogenase [Alphaproteobacteria bacterium]|nr:decarboxylating 6-phosphogluconate dehydrogenase [Alphaproteobacteria bacterium]
MNIGIVGLGRMGSGITRRLLQHGISSVAFDPITNAGDALEGTGITVASSLDDLVAHLTPPRVVWVMVPAGAPTEQVITALTARLDEGDAVIDGGNSFFKDTVARGRRLAEAGVGFVDVGTSGGIWGEQRGYCLMIGGDKEEVARLDPAFRALAFSGEHAPPVATKQDGRPPGYLHCGPVGAGHFVKMIHNGIEYGMMQAYAEGFDILANAAEENVPEEERFGFDLAAIAELWRHGSVVSSWLLDLTAEALAADPQLADYQGHVQDSGEGRWTVATAIERNVPASALTAALYARIESRRREHFGNKLLSAMRAAFGGHVER